MKFRTKIAAVVTTAAVAGVAGIAFAAWNSTVDGTGTARATSADLGTGDLAAATTLSPINDLYPGAVKKTFVTITNDNDYPIVVTKIRAGSSQAAGNCAEDTVRTSENANGGNAVVQSDGTSTLIAPDGKGTYELELLMHYNATDDCEGASFVIGDRADPDTAMVADVRSAAASTSNNW